MGATSMSDLWPQELQFFLLVSKKQAFGLSVAAMIIRTWILIPFKKFQPIFNTMHQDPDCLIAWDMSLWLSESRTAHQKCVHISKCFKNCLKYSRTAGGNYNRTIERCAKGVEDKLERDMSHLHPTPTPMLQKYIHIESSSYILDKSPLLMKFENWL